MKKLILSVMLSGAIFTNVLAQAAKFKESDISLKTSDGVLHGSLMEDVAAQKKGATVALIISGSGPTDRNGNNAQMVNNSLKMLAEGLAANGIATVRYDKRGIAASQAAGKAETDLRFENYINDAAEWIRLLQKDKRFNKVVVIGHSEGSLIGLEAALATNPAAFVSIAGAANSADSILLMQVEKQPDMVKTEVQKIVTELQQGKQVKNYSPYLEALFRPSVQPYLISWMKYKPAKDLKKLKAKTLIIQGKSDLQVPVSEAQLLAKAKPDAKLLVIDNMNHVLKNAPADPVQNIATYANPDLPLAKELVPAITSFVK
ncbi:alpha/beta hydrolase [Adhaeribacter terreus]|uniref:Alpha/beta hydrolase n=1 Tax=Adhaeribacter terreus TaxID=529703 RepID=A0ABW0ECI8_9BACT